MINIYRAKRFFHKNKKRWGYYSDTLWLDETKNLIDRVKADNGVIEHPICVNNAIYKLK